MAGVKEVCGSNDKKLLRRKERLGGREQRAQLADSYVCVYVCVCG